MLVQISLVLYFLFHLVSSTSIACNFLVQTFGKNDMTHLGINKTIPQHLKCPRSDSLLCNTDDFAPRFKFSCDTNGDLIGMTLNLPNMFGTLPSTLLQIGLPNLQSLSIIGPNALDGIASFSYLLFYLRLLIHIF
jgi:hypothetical protein